MNKKRVIKKGLIVALAVMFLSICMSGCTAIGDKSASMSVIYGVTVVMSLLLLIGYCSLVQEKNNWFLLLFLSVLIVNAGYFALSVSCEIEEALLANRISYLGSVFLPLFMLMILLHVVGVKCPKWLVGALFGLGLVVFVIAASPGYSDIYYKQVTLERINGVAVLKKVYGPLHSLYMVYLLGYFGAMVAFAVAAVIRGQMRSPLYSGVLIAAVFLNIGVWLLEQLVKVDFEFLSISYIISELFLLGLYLLMKENERLKGVIQQQGLCVSGGKEHEQTKVLPDAAANLPRLSGIEAEQYLSGLERLTVTERVIFDMYVAGKGTKDIMGELNIKENTLKFHKKNIYGKLGVASRKELISMYNRLKSCNMADR